MTTFRQHTIICVDDNLDTLDLIEVFLFKYFNVHTACNGFEGVKKTQEHLPSLVLTDIMMPVVDGIRLFNNLRKNPATSHIPVIAMTSFLKKITKKSLITMGFNGVIAKPINRSKLLSVIATTLEIPTLLDTLQQQQVTDETTS